MLLKDFSGQITINELGTPFAFVISSVFANRLLIAVRDSHYRGVSDVDTYLPSVRFAKRSRVSSGGAESLNDTIELTTFNERTGV